MSIENRLVSIKEAVTWPGGSREERLFTPIYVYSELGFTVGVEKPGKEAFETPPNKNDMLPAVYQEGRPWRLIPTFLDLYQELQVLSREAGRLPLELIGCLLYRSSWALDHVVVEGHVRWQPPSDVMDEVVASVANIGGLPPQVFLSLLEVLALQEDVKYWTLNDQRLKGGRGRPNNLQTCVYLIAAFLGRVSIVKFAGALARNGVASVPQVRAPEWFPLLKPISE